MNYNELAGAMQKFSHMMGQDLEHMTAFAIMVQLGMLGSITAKLSKLGVPREVIFNTIAESLDAQGLTPEAMLRKIQVETGNAPLRVVPNGEEK